MENQVKMLELTEENAIIGYKGFKNIEGTLKCRDFIYKPGIIYHESGTPQNCFKGFHFCKELEQVFPHYAANQENIFYKVKCWGKIDIQSDKCSSQYIQVLEKVKNIDLLTALLNPYLKYIDRIMNYNPNVIICGSLALIIRGWIKYREIGDIDILLPYFDSFGFYSEVTNEFGGSGKETIKMQITDPISRLLLTFDLFIDPKQIWNWITFNGKAYRVAGIDSIVEAKNKYFLEGNHKHGKDLIQIYQNLMNGGPITNSINEDYQNVTLPSETFAYVTTNEFVEFEPKMSRSDVGVNPFKDLSISLFPLSTLEEINARILGK